jgi:hypothetical protein
VSTFLFSRLNAGRNRDQSNERDEKCFHKISFLSHQFFAPASHDGLNFPLIFHLRTSNAIA